MTALGFFDARSVKQVHLCLSGEMVHCSAYPFPDRKLMVIAESNGLTGTTVLHSEELRERTKGVTEYMRIPNSFRLQAVLEHIEQGGGAEERLLNLRISELQFAYEYLMKCGKMKLGEHKEIFLLLHDIQTDLAEPKRNVHKRAASRNVGKGINYRSPKGGNPVGPVAAITAKASIVRLERRIAQILGVRSFANLRLALVTVFNKEAEQLYKALKAEQSMRSTTFSGLIAQLDHMRVQPFEAPARRIEALYDSFRYADAIESEVFAAIRRELHAVLLVCVVERQIIRRLSHMTHRDLSANQMNDHRAASIHAIDRISGRVAACESFSKDARAIAVSKLEHARNILAQEDLFVTPKKRLDSAARILKELTAILPV